MKNKKKRPNKFRIRLFIIFWIALVIPCMLISYILYQNSQEKSKQSMAEGIQHTLTENMASVEGKLDAVSDAGVSLKFAMEQNNVVMIPDLKCRDIDIYSLVQKTFSTYTSLLDETYNVGGFSGFYLYYPYRQLLLVSDATFFPNVLSNTMDCYQAEVGKWGIATPYQNIICNPTLGKYFNDYDLVRNYEIRDEEGNELYLTACVDERYINRLLSANFQIQPTWLAILDPYGNIVSTKEQQDFKKVKDPYTDIINYITSKEDEQIGELKIDGRNYILNWNYSAANNWYYVSVTDAGKILSENGFPDEIKVFAFVFLTAVAFGAAWTVNAMIEKRNERMLSVLHDIEKQVSENKVPDVLQKPEQGRQADEYMEVSDEFYRMTERVCNVARAALKQKDKVTMTTIQMLQTELDPHMLYNSLESAYSIAKINKQEEIAQLVMALSKFFRIAVSGGKRIVTFREAFELSKQYIIVQNVRVNNKITFVYDIDPEVEELAVPKFLLQPLVENAVIHGFRNKSDKWKIEITALKEKDCVQITVKDDGIGMSEMELEKLNEKICDNTFENSMGNKGYALRNLNYQIQLQYGERSGLTIRSTYGEGTTAVIRLENISEVEKGVV